MDVYLLGGASYWTTGAPKSDRNIDRSKESTVPSAFKSAAGLKFWVPRDVPNDDRRIDRSKAFVVPSPLMSGSLLTLVLAVRVGPRVMPSVTPTASELSATTRTIFRMLPGTILTFIVRFFESIGDPSVVFVTVTSVLPAIFEPPRSTITSPDVLTLRSWNVLVLLIKTGTRSRMFTVALASGLPSPVG